MTRKQHWTRFLKTDYVYGIRDYTRLPRKKKKAHKYYCEKCLHYSKKRGVTVFNTDLLSRPIPEKIYNIFDCGNMRKTHSVRFTRIKERAQ